MRDSNAVMRGAVLLAILWGLSGWASAVESGAGGDAAKIEVMLGRKMPARSEGQSLTKLSDGTWLLAGGANEGRRASTVLT
jgi:hypothetical protein